MSEQKNRFEFEKSPKRKGPCPMCKAKGEFRYYEGLPREFGKCERVNNCGYSNLPPSDFKTDGYQIPPVQKPKELKIVYPDQEKIKSFLPNHASNFHKFCIRLGIPQDHLTKWNVGTNGESTAFAYQEQSTGHFTNVKEVKYSEEGKRTGEAYYLKRYECKGCGAAFDRYLKTCTACNKTKTLFGSEKEKFMICIYGEHTWSTEKDENGRYTKPLCLIESEKSAVIASFFYPQYDWGAFSAAKNLTDEKIGSGVLFNRTVYNLRDADKAGREAHAEKQLAKWKLTYEAVELFPEREDGYDIADAIIDGLRPVITDHLVKTEDKKPKVDYKSMLPDGVDPNDYFKHGFYEHDYAFHSLTKDGPKTVCGFTMRVLFLVKSKSDPKRIVEIKKKAENGTVYSYIVDMHTDCFVSLGNFKKSIEKEGPLVFEGNETDLTRLKKKLFREEKPSIEIKILGWSPEHKLYSFANGVFDGGFKPADEYGIVPYEDKHIFLPFLSRIYSHDKESFKDEKKFKYKESKATFEEWADLISKSYGANGHIGLCFYISSLYRDYIINELDSFPMLYLFGQRDSGKSTMAKSFMRMFGEAQDSISLENPSSTKSIFRTLANFSNALVHLDEYKNSLGKDGVGMLKGFWDGYGYKRSMFSNDTRTHMTPVLSSVITSGQELPNIDNALFTRYILLQFLNALKDKVNQSFDNLKAYEKKNLTVITCEVISHRDAIKKHFRHVYDETFKNITEWFKQAGNPIEQRLVKNISTIMAPVFILMQENLLKLPFTAEELMAQACAILRDQNALIKNSHDSQRFWQIFEFLARDSKLELNVDYKFRDKYIYIRLGKIHPLYMERHKNMYNTIGLDKTTLEHYLRHDNAFITNEKTLRFQVAGKFNEGKRLRTNPTSCWGFDFEKLGIDIYQEEDPQDDLEGKGATA
jgi:hypothetical protein